MNRNLRRRRSSQNMSVDAQASKEIEANRSLIEDAEDASKTRRGTAGPHTKNPRDHSVLSCRPV